MISHLDPELQRGLVASDGVFSAEGCIWLAISESEDKMGQWRSCWRLWQQNQE